MLSADLQSKANGIAGQHWWSFDRDTPCNANASPTCSGTSVPTLGYYQEYITDD